MQINPCLRQPSETSQCPHPYWLSSVLTDFTEYFPCTPRLGKCNKSPEWWQYWSGEIDGLTGISPSEAKLGVDAAICLPALLIKVSVWTLLCLPSEISLSVWGNDTRDWLKPYFFSSRVWGKVFLQLQPKYEINQPVSFVTVPKAIVEKKRKENRGIWEGQR